ncbi:MAG: phosphotransferase family protein [Candidatus Methanospirareceae archaeon]
MEENIRRYLEKKFKEQIRILDISELGVKEERRGREIKGFGYGKPILIRFERGGGGIEEVVLSTMKKDGFGHDFLSDRAQIMIWQYHAFNKLPRHVKAIDVGYITKDGRIESVSEAEEYFILCEKVEGVEYYKDLERIKEGGELRGIDKERAISLASYLADIHAVRKEDEESERIYKRRIRELIGHSECIFGLIDSYPSGSGVISGEELKGIERECVEWRWRLKERWRRLCQVHGDFHPWNVIFRGGTDFSVLDRSRGEWGEAADDVSSMTINYLFFGLLKTDGEGVDRDFKRLYDIFFETYLKETGDEELLEVIQPFYAFRGLVLASPIWYPNISAVTRGKLFNFIKNVLKDEEFDYKGVEKYLSGQ